MGTEAFFLPVEPVAQCPVILAKPIAAIQVLPARENGLLRLGLLSRLPAGAVLHICGDGFDKRTAKVLVDGQYYFVFVRRSTGRIQRRPRSITASTDTPDLYFNPLSRYLLRGLVSSRAEKEK